MKAAFILLGALGVAVLAWFWLASSTPSNILIEDAIASPMKDGRIGIFLTVNNQGSPDRLISASSSAGAVTLHKAFGTDDLPIQVGRSALASDAAHILIPSGEVAFEIGVLLPVTLTFANAGNVQLKARMSEPAMQDHAGMAMGSEMRATDIDMPAPTVLLAASPQGDGWRIAITTENFEFSEEKVGAPHEAGTGHAHIYAGGMKLGRVYGPDYLVGELPAGSHDIRIVLNTNDHRPYMGADGPVMATTVIEVD
ncbi:MAG: hypothetical protein WBB25_02580 [Sulfitobacter sp.]